MKELLAGKTACCVPDDLNSVIYTNIKGYLYKNRGSLFYCARTNIRMQDTKCIKRIFPSLFA